MVTGLGGFCFSSFAWQTSRVVFGSITIKSGRKSNLLLRSSPSGVGEISRRVADVHRRARVSLLQLKVEVQVGWLLYWHPGVFLGLIYAE